MKFLYPQFLYALAAIAIPILIHLFNFKKYKTVYFSNVQFLKSVKQQSKAQQQLKHWLILLSRIFSIVALVLAFAQPYLPSESMRAEGEKSAASIFIDNSFSMDAEGEKGRLLPEAKQQALAVLDNYSATDQFQILTQSLEGKHQRLLNKEQFIHELDRLESSSGSHSFAQVVKRQRQALSQATETRKDIYLISDFPTNASQLDEWSADTMHHYRLIPMSPHSHDNLYIDSCWLSSPNPQAGQSITVYARLNNNGQSKRENVKLQLSLNGNIQAVSTIDVAGTAIAELQLLSPEAGFHSGYIQLQDHPITFDDDWHFTLEVKKSLQVQTIYQESASQALFKLFDADPYFNYSSQSVVQLNHASLSKQDFIILESVQNISTGLTESLHQFVKNGGSLLIFPGEEMNTDSYRLLLQTLGSDHYQNLLQQASKLQKLDRQHPLFEGVFEDFSTAIDLPELRRYWEISNYNQTNRRPLIQLENQQGFINHYSYGNGQLYLASVGLEASFSNFSQHALFVPILYQMAALSSNTIALSHVLGEHNIPYAKSANSKGYRLKKENFECIPDYRNGQLWLHDQLKEKGSYQLFNETEQEALLSFNYNRKESQNQTHTIEELAEWAAAHEHIDLIKPYESSVTQQLNELDKGKALWKLCLIFVLVFLALETLIIKRL
jgi:hypothetical protein